MMRPRASTIILIAVLVLTQFNSSYGQYEKERFTEDAIDVDGTVYRIMIDSDSGNVVSFWDERINGWIDALLCPVDLNEAYRDRITMKDMQDELDRMRSESWDDRYHGTTISH